MFGLASGVRASRDDSIGSIFELWLRVPEAPGCAARLGGRWSLNPSPARVGFYFWGSWSPGVPSSKAMWGFPKIGNPNIVPLIVGIGHPNIVPLIVGSEL